MHHTDASRLYRLYRIAMKEEARHKLAMEARDTDRMMRAARRWTFAEYRIGVAVGNEITPAR
jgi:hypothetical protein